MIDQYQPDFLYTDGGIPFGVVGRSLMAHFYNSNMAEHGGKLEAVYAFKNLGTGEFIPHAGVEDVERGVWPGINPLPWETCTSMGDWFYSDGFKYKTTAEVVHMLADIVSKNGNLLLNVVLYADGSLPPESRQFLDEMAAWMSVNGEAIYGTRPIAPYKDDRIVYTQKGKTIFAIYLPEQEDDGLPDRVFLAGLKPKTGSKIHLLGFKPALQWKVLANGTTAVVIPEKLRQSPPCRNAFAFKFQLADEQ